MVSNDLFLASPGTDGTEANQEGIVSIGGWTNNAVQEPNLTVNNKTRMVGIGTTTPTFKLQVAGKITAVSCQTDTIYATDATLSIKDKNHITMASVQYNDLYVTRSLYVNGIQVSTSDKRLKFNEKPLVNALVVINGLEPVEYDQTDVLVDQYMPDTPKSHRCGFIAQSVQNIEELRHVVIGGEVGEDGTGKSARSELQR
ncbi:MAG: tail fiber domain-containing protein, partial [Candidatus Fonsibacter sp.]